MLGCAINTILQKDLEEAKISRESLIDALKLRGVDDEETKYIVKNILTHNVVINELESILARAQNENKDESIN